VLRCALLALGLARPAQAAEGEVSTALLVYSDDDHVTVISPRLGGRAELGALTLDARYTVDAVSAASVDLVTAASPAGFSELRHQASGAAEHALGAGARVRVIYDAIGSIDMTPALETLMRNAGVQLLEYHPVAPWRPRWAWNRRDHRKMLVCDGRVGFVGGMNLNDENAPADAGGGDWRDAHARVEGPAARDLDLLFRDVWSAQTGRWFESVGDAAARPGGSRVKIAANQELLKRFVIRKAYVNALIAAREEVSIASAYFLPDWRIRRALAHAARRGVDVRVMVPGRSDSSAVWHAMRARYDALLSRGVRIFEWQGPMMHAKAVVVDRQWASVGTFNLDHRSLRHNLEVNVNVLDRAFAAELAAQFELGLKGSREVALADWRRRAWLDRVRERFWLSFDYFF